MTSPRFLAVLVALLLAAAACGGSGEPPPTEEATGEAADQPERRTISHDMGETDVPADPQRVVTLDSPHLDAALALDVTPVGSVQSAVDEGLPAYLGDRVEGVEIVGTIEEPDLEAIAALEPDLILSATVRHEEIYDELSQIAPTVFSESSGTDWKDGFTLVAEALGRAEEGEQALADYRERAEEVGAATDAEELLAGIVRFLPDETRIYGPDTFSGSVLHDVGFDLPTLEYDEYSMAYISPEQVELLEDADVIFSATYGDPEATTQAAVTGLWGNLPAVASDCQLAVEDDEWMIGIGLIGAEIILDDVESFLTDRACG